MLHTLPSPRSGLQLYALRLAQPEREAARLAIRAEVAQLLRQENPLDGKTEQLGLISNIRGQAPRLLSAPQAPEQLHLSFSYEGAWAVCALQQGAAVGIDLLRLPLADWAAQPQHWQQLAADYLPPQQAARIWQVEAGQQAQAFARAWVMHEARLKCLGQPLQEWQADLSRIGTDIQTSCVRDLPWVNGDSRDDQAAVWALGWASHAAAPQTGARPPAASTIPHTSPS